MFDIRVHGRQETGKPKSIRRPGMQVSMVEEYLDYKIEFTQRAASPISSRITWSVRVDGGEPLRRAYLSGFLTERSARAAAHTEISRLEAKFGDAVSPIANILNSLKRQRAARDNRSV